MTPPLAWIKLKVALIFVAVPAAILLAWGLWKVGVALLRAVFNPRPAGVSLRQVFVDELKVEFGMEDDGCDD